jgi:murein endopeptidase
VIEALGHASKLDQRGLLSLVAVPLLVASVLAGTPAPERKSDSERERVEWRHSVAVGTHGDGSLRRGVMLPAEGRQWVSWDPIEKRRPSREWRRWGTDRLVRTTLRVMREFGRDHPAAPRVAIGDLSLPEGGFFGPQYGFIGHATHQNGLDIDVYYPRLDGRVRPPDGPEQVDVELAQDLVDRFVAEGAEVVYVGPNLPLDGPAGVVVPLANHDNHLHARLPLP